MSENVKIKIAEVDNTLPTSRSAGSSDIVFIPGLATVASPDEMKVSNYRGKVNIPVLCNSVAEFEKHFGKKPYQLTSNDIVEAYKNLGYQEGDYDKSYLMAKELLYQGMPVIYAHVAADPSVANKTDGKLKEFYDNIDDVLTLVSDKSMYSVKYLTTGGYPSVIHGDSAAQRNLCATDLVTAAANRGDAVALVDYQLTDSMPLLGDSDSVYSDIKSVFETATNGEYGAAMYPWATYSCANGYLGITGDKIKNIPESTSMPASYAYLMCVAKAIKSSPNWLAMAGVSRGVVPGIKNLITRDPLTNTIAEEMQPKFGSTSRPFAINCITNIRPYGLTIWGNRTLKPLKAEEGTVALNFLNIRNMLSDIKKVLYTTGKSLMFEQNTESLWARFKAGVSPLLNQLVTGGAISDFKIIKGTTKYDGTPLTKGELAAVVKIYPVYAVEYFELTVEINDSDVTVA